MRKSVSGRCLAGSEFKNDNHTIHQLKFVFPRGFGYVPLACIKTKGTKGNLVESSWKNKLQQYTGVLIKWLSFLKKKMFVPRQFVVCYQVEKIMKQSGFGWWLLLTKRRELSGHSSVSPFVFFLVILKSWGKTQVFRLCSIDGLLNFQLRLSWLTAVTR